MPFGGESAQCRAARERLPRLLLEWRIDDLRLVVGGRPADSPDLAARIAPVAVDLRSEGHHLKQAARLTAVRTGAASEVAAVEVGPRSYTRLLEATNAPSAIGQTFVRAVRKRLRRTRDAPGDL